MVAGKISTEIGYGVSDINHSTTDSTGTVVFDTGHDKSRLFSPQ